ncbi:MAG: segregation protein B [Acidobacteria bacterium]|nr:segregation protein B [Acidobacteriota bacterium]
MTSNYKPAAAPSTDLRRGELYRVAIVGASSLKGKELADVLNERNFPSSDVRLLDDDEAIGQLEAMKDEITFIQSLRNEQFEQIDFTFFASDVQSTRESWKVAQNAGSTIIDLSYGLEEEAGAMVRSPWLERQLGQTVALDLQPGPCVVAHPMAVALALVLLRAKNVGAIDHAVATVFEPASEHAQKGMDELHEQTVNLLSFQQLPKKIFDVQVAFNMVQRYGEQSSPTLASVEGRVLKHYRKIAGPDAPLPSLLLLQAPIFHGYAFALHVAFSSAVDMEGLHSALAGDHISITRLAEEAPSNVNAAGQDGISLSVLPEEDRPGSVWIWGALDNLRVAAASAVECAETMAATRPRGQIQ